jgi:hypothetical protein
LPPQTQFDYSWTLRKIALEEQVDHLAYSTSSETYVFASSQRADFKLPEGDDLHPEWRNEGLSLRIADLLLLCFANAAFRHIFLSENPSEQHKGHQPQDMVYH